MYQEKVRENELGEYLGEIGNDSQEQEFFNELRLKYIGKIHFNGIFIVTALRKLFNQSGFMYYIYKFISLPADQQAIEVFIDSFSKCYYNDNKQLFSDESVCNALVFAIFILNSEIYNSDEVNTTKDIFIEQNRGIDNGNDISEVY